MKTISKRDLELRLKRQPPNNDDPRNGYALVNVLSPENFEAGHIPGSINIPQNSYDEFGRRFDTVKEIIVYCASPTCTASTQTAERLIEQGFQNVIEYEGGMTDWLGREDLSEGGNVEIGARL